MRQYEGIVREIVVSIFYKHFQFLIFHLIYLLHNHPLHCGNITIYAGVQLEGCHQNHPQHACNNPQYNCLISLDYFFGLFNDTLIDT